MRPTSWLSTLVLVFFSVLFFQAARGSTDGYDSFSYAAESLSGKNGGTGWSGAWGTGKINIVATGLSHPSGGLTQSGGATELHLTSSLETTTSTRTLTTSMGTAGTTVWYSFLLKPDKTGVFDYEGLNIGIAGTQYFFGYQGTNFVLNKAGGGGSSVSLSFASVGFSVGQTAFVVLKLVCMAGNDTATLYINPSAGLSAPDAPSSNIGTKNDINVSTFSNIVITGGRGFSANDAQVDEIRIATTYTDVAPQTVLPIQLSSFTAHVLPGTQQVDLDWTTLTETNNYGFEIQKSTGSEANYQTILNSFVPGHGTTLEPHSYSYADAGVPLGAWYYRLKQMDLDGSINYTDGVQVDVLTGVEEEELPGVFALEQNYPNPFNPSTLIQYSLLKEGAVSLKVYNTLGQEVTVLAECIQKAGEYKVQLNANNMASGVYIYRLNADGLTASRKLMLLR